MATPVRGSAARNVSPIGGRTSPATRWAPLGSAGTPSPGAERVVPLWAVPLWAAPPSVVPPVVVRLSVEPLFLVVTRAPALQI